MVKDIIDDDKIEKFTLEWQLFTFTGDIADTWISDFFYFRQRTEIIFKRFHCIFPFGIKISNPTCWTWTDFAW